MSWLYHLGSKTKFELVVNLHTPRSNEGYQRKGDGEDNPEDHVLVVKKINKQIK